ncbi:FAD-dependent oxidoreductase [Thermodesulfobacteriota bacterium]
MAFEHLLSPINIGNLTLKNRIVMASVGTGFFDHFSVTERVKDFYLARAKGGVGMIITGGTTFVRSPNTKAPVIICHAGMHDDKFIPGWKKLVDEIHRFDVKIGMQLTHFGRQISFDQWGEPPISSSAIPCPVCKSAPRELNLEEIDELIDRSVDAARRCQEAGFDLMEIHGAHGYLGTQFLSPYMNKRNDEYGRNAEGRTRFIREIIQRTKKALGPEFSVGVRYNGHDHIEGGATLEDAKEIAPLLQEAGADYLHISATVYGGYPPISPMAEPPGCYVPLAEGVKSVVKVPVIAVGKIDTPQLAEDILRENRADLVALARPLIADPEWPNKAAAGKPEKIRKCIFCNQGCLDKINELNLEGKLTSITCLINPEVGKEEELKLKPAQRRKKVLVVGGGPAGLEAARVAAVRGHQVVLYEKEKELGGQFLLASLPPTKQHYRDAVDYLVEEIQDIGVEIRVGCEGVLQSVMEINPEVVVIATGAIPLIPEISGVGNKHVATYDKVLSGQIEAAQSVLVIGGGSVGMEVADFLSSQGKSVSVVEMTDRFATDMGKVAWFGLRRRLSAKKVELVRSCKVTMILDQKVEVVQGDQKKTLDGFNTVVLAVGSQPVNSLVGEIKKSIKEVYVIGDALEPRKAIDAIYEGTMIGRKI